MDRGVGIESSDSRGRRLAAEHRPAAIAARLAAPLRPSYLRDMVYGAIDGTVTTYAVVAGVAGGGLDAPVVLVLGTANLVADGFSMAVANYLGIRSEERRWRRIQRDEERHIELVPAGEREEVRQLLARDGLSGELLDAATDAVTSDRQRWVDVMMAREHGFAAVRPDPLRAAGCDVPRLRRRRTVALAGVRGRRPSWHQRCLSVRLEHGVDGNGVRRRRSRRGRRR